MFIATKWTLKEALELIRNLQPECRKYGYHLCLGGGVLNKGESEKDLDLYFLPMGKKESIKTKEMVRWMAGLWGKPKEFWKDKPLRDRNGDYVIRDGGVALDEYPASMKDFYTFAGKFNFDGLRIDVFVYGEGEGKANEVWSEFKKEGKVNKEVGLRGEDVDIGQGVAPPEAPQVPRNRDNIWGAAINNAGGANWIVNDYFIGEDAPFPNVAQPRPQAPIQQGPDENGLLHAMERMVGRIVVRG